MHHRTSTRQTRAPLSAGAVCSCSVCLMCMLFCAVHASLNPTHLLSNFSLQCARIKHITQSAVVNARARARPIVSKNFFERNASRNAKQYAHYHHPSYDDDDSRDGRAQARANRTLNTHTRRRRRSHKPLHCLSIAPARHICIPSASRKTERHREADIGPSSSLCARGHSIHGGIIVTKAVISRVWLCVCVCA